MGVRSDCRHYSSRRVSQTGELVQRCRLDAAEALPFACPDGCLFFEQRTVSTAGWQVGEGDPPVPTEPDETP